MPTQSQQADELSEKLAKLKRAFYDAARKNVELQLQEAAIMSVVRERRAWLTLRMKLKTSCPGSAAAAVLAAETEISAMLSGLNLSDSAPLDVNSGSPDISSSTPGTNGAPSAPQQTQLEYVRSQVAPEMIQQVKSWTHEDCNRACTQFVRDACSLLQQIDQAPTPEAAAASSKQLDDLVAYCFGRTVVAHIMNPGLVKATVTTRMDTNAAVSEPGGEVWRPSVQAMQLSDSQRQTITSAYAVYLRAVPERQRRQLLQKLSSASEAEPWTLSMEPVNDPHELLQVRGGSIKSYVLPVVHGQYMAVVIGRSLALNELSGPVVLQPLESSTLLSCSACIFQKRELKTMQNFVATCTSCYGLWHFV